MTETQPIAIIVPLQAYTFKGSDYNSIDRCPLAYNVMLHTKTVDNAKIIVSANNVTVNGVDYRIKQSQRTGIDVPELGGYRYRQYKADCIAAKDCGYDNTVIREVLLIPYHLNVVS